MFEALIVTLREGIEAALVVGIIVAFLRREGCERYLGAVWGGIATAVAGEPRRRLRALPLAGQRGGVRGGPLPRLGRGRRQHDGLDVAALARSVAGEMKGSLSRILARERRGAVAAGLFLFTFLMVFREGIETVLFLSALSLTTSGLVAFLGAALGLGSAIAFGVLFVRGSLRIDLGRFFKITGIALLHLRRPAPDQRVPRAVRGRLAAGERADHGDRRAAGAATSSSSSPRCWRCRSSCS